jgi:acyl carrier protein phosphodiesterase
MNYLAHAYLSLGIPEITVGNLISDFVKGKKKLDYPAAIQRGIVLHRAIDTFTDMHEATRRAKSFFKKDYGLYAGPLTDIVYDHFLANDPAIFPLMEGGLKAFAQTTYRQVGSWRDIFPERFARVFHYMQTQDWLSHYGEREAIWNSFAGLARRAAYMDDTQRAGQLFETHYIDLEVCYRDFFPSVDAFARRDLEDGLAGSGKML